MRPTATSKWLLAALLLAAPSTARALTCSYSVSNASFGSVDMLSGSAVDTTATVGINCSGLPLERVRLCPNLGAGSGGATASARQMASAANKLNYQLYQNSARTTVWGSYFWSFSAQSPALTLDLNALGSGALTPTIYARVSGGQSTAPTGSYLSTFSGIDAQLGYATCPLGVCPACSASLAGSTNASFTVNASVLNNCLVSAQNIDFGATGVLNANVDATGQLTVTCTPTTSYTVALNGGTTGSPPASRKMSKGSETVTYGLYQDSARSQVWGDTSGTTVPGTGTGLAQSLIVYGRVPPQPTPSPGLYSDTVVVTVTY
ncbi:MULTISPECIES: spore coat protein U domain-containing protein [unclassified Bradyrhizobium]|uniref:Csu type fimbrial protein n=1 Tax=unclassified Bradyrhizobium TaxID=2631580 RepID=UPI001FF93C6F|nr:MULTISPECIES: spore coat protein U domain-containing protein [unclassified Bradyrhizobium]MCK1712495.1 spore coat U domain-containing protein [Bradyrhizobium sp. 143]MCK1726810.1 spore coat U domain-containing protein [Bradyrhizobium sp. 142]